MKAKAREGIAGMSWDEDLLVQTIIDKFGLEREAP